MKISIYDPIRNIETELTAEIRKGEMFIVEWNDVMSILFWISSGSRAFIRTSEEWEAFESWIAPAKAILRSLGGKPLSSSDIAKASGVTTARVRQLAPKIPHALKTKGGWLFPPSAVDFVKSQPPPGPVPKTKGRTRFEVSYEDRNKIAPIASRALEVWRKHKFCRSYADTINDLIICHAGETPLNLQGLFEANEIDFERDLLGINKNLNRLTGKLENGFKPIFALHPFQK